LTRPLTAAVLHAEIIVITRGPMRNKGEWLS